MKRIFRLALSSILLLPQGATQSRDEQTITIDGRAASRPFPHFWEQMFGSGRAILSLRESYRNDLRLVKEVTDFKYVRFHGILDDEVGVYDTGKRGKTEYNFSYVDQIYDGLLANGVKPFVEIGFMPKALAANPKPHAFWYKPYPSPPNDPEAWVQLISAFAQHLVGRYGADEVEQWYFEVWNEPNIDFWNGDPKQDTYFALYKLTATAIKKVDPKIRVGGPATAQAVWVDEFIAYCRQEHVPFDFVSTHIYGNEDPVNVFGRSMEIPRKDMVGRAIQKVHDQVVQSNAGKIPIFISEFNATYLTQVEVTDSAFMGPWLANTIRECDGLAELMSYWTFSDVFEEQGVLKAPFYGGYGLVAERGVPKAAYRAFELLHQLGDERIANESPDALITKRKDGALVAAFWNYAEPDEKVAQKTFHLRVTNRSGKSYRLQVVDPTNGSALAAWIAMDKPATPTLSQINKLIEASKLTAATEHPMNEAIRLNARALALVTIR